MTVRSLLPLLAVFAAAEFVGAPNAVLAQEEGVTRSERFRPGGGAKAEGAAMPRK